MYLVGSMICRAAWSRLIFQLVPMAAEPGCMNLACPSVIARFALPALRSDTPPVYAPASRVRLNGVWKELLRPQLPKHHAAMVPQFGGSTPLMVVSVPGPYHQNWFPYSAYD